MDFVRELPLDQVLLGDCIATMGMLPSASIHCVFADKADADEFSDVVSARTVGKYPGWASQRAFIIDEGTRSAISEVLETAPL